MKVAALQMVSTPRLADNLAQARALIAQAAQAGAELVALPEYFCLMGWRDQDKLAVAEPLFEATPDATPATVPDAALTPMQHMLASAALEHGLWVIGGTLPIRSDEAERVRNTVLVFDPQGQRVARYDKMHLFCFDDGQRRYNEAATLTPGTQPVSFDLTDKQGHNWHIGLSVCYDLRFPELFRTLGQARPLDLIVLPAAFTDTTGLAHWELLLRARAVENLCHVLAPAQGGLHENGRRTFGHSLAIGPWGDVLAELDLARQAQVRAQLPALTHRVL
jgi:predicted amidohydrolase